MTHVDMIAVFTARVDRVRELYGLGQPLPPEVTLWREVPTGLVIRKIREHGRPRDEADDSKPHARCGRVAWVRRDCADGSRACTWCEAERARMKRRRRPRSGRRAVP